MRLHELRQTLEESISECCVEVQTLVKGLREPDSEPEAIREKIEAYKTASSMLLSVLKESPTDPGGGDVKKQPSGDLMSAAGLLTNEGGVLKVKQQ